MTVIYVIGPSGTGKSSLCRALTEKDTSLIYVDLDDAARARAKFDHVSLMLRTLGDYRFWQYCQAIFNDLEKAVSGQDHLVDVGAGSLQTPESRTYFKACRQRVMCIWVMPELAYDRKHKSTERTYEDMVATEYSSKRTELYDAVPFRVDTSNQTPDASLTQCQQTLADLRSKL